MGYHTHLIQTADFLISYQDARWVFYVMKPFEKNICLGRKKVIEIVP